MLPLYNFNFIVPVTFLEVSSTNASSPSLSGVNHCPEYAILAYFCDTNFLNSKVSLSRIKVSSSFNASISNVPPGVS